MAKEIATPVALSGRIPLEMGQGSRWRSPIRSVRFMSHFWRGWRNLHTQGRRTTCHSHTEGEKACGTAPQPGQLQEKEHCGPKRAAEFSKISVSSTTRENNKKFYKVLKM